MECDREEDDEEVQDWLDSVWHTGWLLLWLSDTVSLAATSLVSR